MTMNDDPGYFILPHLPGRYFTQYVLHQHNRGKTNMHCIVLELEYKPRKGIVFIKNKQAFCKYDSYSRFKINVCLDLLVRLNRTLLSFLIFLLAEPFNTNSKWSDFLSKIFKKTKTGSKESIKIYNLFIVKGFLLNVLKWCLLLNV